MKPITLLLIFLSIVLNISSFGETRTWTSTAGSKLTAEIIDFSNRIVILRSSEGQKITLPINKLIPADQMFVTKWANEKQAVKNAAKSSYSRNTVEKNQQNYPVEWQNYFHQEFLTTKENLFPVASLQEKWLVFISQPTGVPPAVHSPLLSLISGTKIMMTLKSYLSAQTEVPTHK